MTGSAKPGAKISFVPGNRFAHPRYDVLTRRQGLTRRANHLHMFNIKNLKPAPGNWSRAF